MPRYPKQPGAFSILLAAGNAKRMAEPKQILSSHTGNPMIYDASVKLLGATGSDTLVVLGAYADTIFHSISALPVNIVLNKNWAEGLSSSIRCAVEWVQLHRPGTERLLFMLADLPYITTSHLLTLVNSVSIVKPIAATKYQDQVRGVPVAFSKEFCEELKNLEGDKGAGVLLEKYASRVCWIDFHRPYLDIDRPADYAAYIRDGQNP
jgi:molybdenum cofactor cytidylyltransferase